MTEAMISARRGSVIPPIVAAMAVVGCVGLALFDYHLSFLFASLFTLLVCGVPIAISLAGSCLMYVLLTGRVPMWSWCTG